MKGERTMTPTKNTAHHRARVGLDRSGWFGIGFPQRRQCASHRSFDPRRIMRHEPVQGRIPAARS
jgi:hypothetical protein